MQNLQTISNIQATGDKFWVVLECGHMMLYDESVDSIEEYNIGDRLTCYKCQ